MYDIWHAYPSFVTARTSVNDIELNMLFRLHICLHLHTLINSTVSQE